MQIDKLTTEELFAVVLREKPDSLIVKELAARYSSSQSFYQASVRDFQEIKGIGPAKASLIKVIVELGYRIMTMLPYDDMPLINGTLDAVKLLYPRLSPLDREYFEAIYLNAKHRVLAIETIFVGTLDGAIVHPRELFKGALKHSAAKIIVAHNHPSGDPQPSPDDIDVTERLVAAGHVIGIQLWDHIVIGGNNYVSMKNSGLI